MENFPFLCLSDILALGAIALALLAAASLVLARRKAEDVNARIRLQWTAGIATALAVAALGLRMAVACPTGARAACPAPLTGTGYVCPSPAPKCGIFGGGTCTTVKGSMPWDSPCECKCI